MRESVSYTTIYGHLHILRSGHARAKHGPRDCERAEIVCGMPSGAQRLARLELVAVFQFII